MSNNATILKTGATVPKRKTREWDGADGHELDVFQGIATGTGQPKGGDFCF